MENTKNKIWVIAFILTLSLLTGCSITTTRNQYYGCPDAGKNTNQKESVSKHAVDKPTNKRIDRN